IRLEPRDAKAYLIRGRAYHCRNKPGDLEKAIADFSESIRIDPKQAEAFYSRSIAYRDQGDAEKSADDDKQARKNDGRVEETYSHLPEVGPPPPDSGDTATETAEKGPENAPDPAKTDINLFSSRRLKDEEA